MNKTKKIIKTAFIYFVGNVSSKLLAFLLIPLYTSYISTSDYGTYDIIVSIISLIVPIVFFQIWDAMFRFVYDYEKINDKYKIVTNGLAVCSFSIFMYEILMIVGSLFLNIPCFTLVNIYGITIALQYIFGTVARTLKENKLYMYSGVLNTIINLSINLLLILVFHQNKINTLFISVIIGNIIQCLLIAIKLRIFKNIKTKYISKDLIIKMIKFSSLIGISTISYWLLSGYTKLAISRNLGTSSNGIFAIANKLASAIVMVVSVLQMAWQEVSFESANQKDRKVFYEKGLNCLMVLLALSSSFILLAIKLFFYILVKGDYAGASIIIPIVIIYTAINSFAGFSSSQFFAERDSKVALYTTLISAIVNVLIVNILIIRYDILGASIALLISFSLNTSLRSIVLYKKYKIRTYFSSILLSTLIYALSAFSYYILNNILNVLFVIIMVLMLFVIYRKSIISFADGLKNSLTNRKERKNRLDIGS